MSFITSTVLRTAALAWCIGGLYAAFVYARAEHVREFQALGADPADLGERLNAWFQRTAIETVGFVLVAVIAAIAARLLSRGDDARARGLLAALAGALWVWVRHGAYFGEEFVPFLPPFQLALLSLVGWGLPAAALAAAARISTRLPLARGATFEGACYGAALVAVLGSEAWREVVRESGGLKSLASIGTLLGVLVLLVLAAAPLGRLLQTVLVGPLRARAETLPGGLRRVLSGAVVATLLVGGLLRLLSPPAPLPKYARLDSERPAASADTGARKVIFVLIDTLRADALGCYGYDRPTSPRIDALAAQGTVFTDVSSPAAWTKPSTASVLTGLWPSRHGALQHGSNLRTPEGVPTLAEAFAEAGFATAGFVSNPNVKANFEFDRGFDEFFDKPVDDNVPNAAIRDSLFGNLLMAVTRYQFNWKYANDIFAMNRHVESWLRTNAEEDFFLYVHYIDPHTPYAPPARWRREFERSHPGFPLHTRRRALVGRDLYDAEVRTIDEGFASILDLLEELGIADETLIAITSDHGEEFDEKGMFEHGKSLYQAEVFVPMIFAGPGVAPQRVATPVNTTQIPATLLEMAGIEHSDDGTPPVFGDARSVGQVLRGESFDGLPMNFLENEFTMSQAPTPDFVHQGLRDGPWKLVLTQKSKDRPIDRYPSEELFNISTDPNETRNLFYDEDQQDRVERLMERLRAHRTFLEAKGLRGSGTRELSQSDIDQLKALGYMTDEE